MQNKHTYAHGLLYFYCLLFKDICFPVMINNISKIQHGKLNHFISNCTFIFYYFGQCVLQVWICVGWVLLQMKRACCQATFHFLIIQSVNILILWKFFSQETAQNKIVKVIVWCLGKMKKKGICFLLHNIYKKGYFETTLISVR